VNKATRASALCGLLSLLGVVGADGCASTHQSVGKFKAREHVGPAGTTLPIVLAPLVDTRPAILRDEHEASRSGMFGLCLGYIITFGAEEVVGVDSEGDEENWIAVDGEANKASDTSVSQLDRYVAKVVAAASGTKVTRSSATVELARVERTGAMVPGGEGFFLVPILDQFDVVRMRRESLLLGAGSSSSTSGGTTTTTTVSGSSSTGNRTAHFANVRMRLLLGRVQAGQVVRTTVLYAAGSGDGMYPALDGAVKQLGAGVEKFLEDDVNAH
jgi:hypothetical protein